MSRKSSMRRGGDFRFSAFGAVLAVVGCAVATQEDSPVDENTGGGGGAAGSGLGGVSTGGVSTGGVSTGGVSTGGVSTGGVSTGGVSTGGTGAGRGGAGGMSGSAGRGGSAFGGAAGMGGATSGGAGGKGGSAGAGGRGGSAGTGGRAGGASGAGGRGGSGTTDACPNPRMPAEPANSGSFMTTMAVCYEVTATFNAWDCSNLGNRTVAVNGTPVMCSEWPLPARIDGAYYFEFSAGSPDYTSFFWFTQ